MDTDKLLREALAVLKEIADDSRVDLVDSERRIRLYEVVKRITQAYAHERAARILWE